MALGDKTLSKRMESLALSFRIEIAKLKQLSLLRFYPIFVDDQPEEPITPIRGISTYGPYDVNTSDKFVRRKNNVVQIFAFCPKNEPIVKKRLKNLLELLKDGYARKDWKDVDFPGFEEAFRIKAIFPDEVETYEPGKFDESIRERGVRHEAESNKAVPLAIIGGTTHRSVRVNRELYIESKKVLTDNQVASQYASFYEYEHGGAGILYKVEDEREPFGYSLWTFSLNLYGKIGGLAWIVKQILSKDTEKTIDLSIGFRFARKNGTEGQKYYVGHATIIDRFGRLVGIVTSKPFTASQAEMVTEGMIVPKATMENIVLSALQLAFSDPRVNDNLKAKKKLNITIFNLYRFDPNQEVRGILSALNSIRESGPVKFEEVRVGLISIISRPSYFLFNDNEILSETGRALVLNKNSLLVYTAKREAKLVYPIVAHIQNFESTYSIL